MFAVAEIKIDEEFASLIPPLTEEERQQLQANLLADGCRDPLAVWEKHLHLLAAGLTLCGWTEDRKVYAEVRPHIAQGYCHVAVIRDLATAEGTRRGVRSESADWLLRRLNCDPASIHWTVERRERSAHGSFGIGQETAEVQQKAAPSTVYFIHVEGGGPVKIGVAVDPASRLQALQSACPFPLRIIGTVPDGGEILERKLHRLFHAGRLRGEWFEPSPELIAWINQYAEAQHND